MGNARRREYTLIGDVVSLAARLMQAAGGTDPGGAPPAGEGILCDEATYQAARGRVGFEELPPVAVKGKTGRIGTYRPVEGLERRETRRAAMVGRSVEREGAIAVFERLGATWDLEWARQALAED